MRIERFEFSGRHGQRLAGRLDAPDGEASAHAVFAHCFTCGKDVLAASRIAHALAERGIATLRFDFTGLGSSDGDFANTGFSSNVEDLVAAAAALRGQDRAPRLLVGHSLGGAAVLAAAAQIPEVAAVATIGAPFEAGHVLGLIEQDLPAIARQGSAQVSLAGRRFTIRQSFVEDLRAQDQAARIRDLGRPLMILHAPEDSIVPIANAEAILAVARYPKALVALDGADHLLSRRADSDYAATLIAAWATRHLGAAATPEVVDGVVVEETGRSRLQQLIMSGPHRLLADEPVDAGGAGTGPNPYDLLLAALGACTSMTIRLYAERKGWPLARIRVALQHRKIYARDCADCETREGKLDEIERRISFEGNLDAEQRQRLLEIAEKCPVHRTLHSEIKIRTS